MVSIPLARETSSHAAARSSFGVTTRPQSPSFTMGSASETPPPPRYQSTSTDVSVLGQPLNFEFSGRVASNRFMKAAMTEQLWVIRTRMSHWILTCFSSSWHKEIPEKRGIPTKNLCRVYERWGRGGIGMIVTGNISTGHRLDYVWVTPNISA
jgi:hypothetical protein